jgi:type IV pilus assembly protein PilQ
MEDANAGNTIQGLNVSVAPDGQLILAVTLKSAPAALPGNFSSGTPPRLAFDFAGTTNGLGKSVQEVNQGELRNINIVQAGNRTRLVVNLTKMMSYTTKIEGNNVVISLNSLAAAQPTSHFAEAAPTVQGHSLRNIEFHRGNGGEGRIEITLSDTGTGIDMRQEGSKIIVDFLNTKAPRSLQRKLDVIDFATPVESVDTFSQGDNIRMVVTPTGLWEQTAYQTDDKFVIEIKPRRPEERVTDKPTYSKDKLNLTFQNISIREALGVIADFTHMNIVISDTVTGNLTLRLKDVPWDQALAIMLQAKGLGMIQEGNVIQVAPRDEIDLHIKQTAQVKIDIDDITPLHTESFRLSYQKGADIVSLIANKDQRILSKRGSAVVDARTNTVFVQDTPSRLEEVRKLIKQIDVPVRQVLIEARFVSATEKASRTLGGSLSFSSTNQAAPTAGFHVGGGQLGNAVGVVNTPAYNSGTGGVSFNLFNPANTKTLQLQLTATQLEGSTKSIASPRVVTADNVQAQILSGTEIPYLQSAANGTATIAFKDAVLSLMVTPKITPDDHVNMKLTVNKDTVGAIYGNIPSIDTSKVVTEVQVENGGTVVIGGVFTKDDTDSSDKVPLLGDLPIIGWLFKTDTKTANRSELLIFITPKILKDSLSIK